MYDRFPSPLAFIVGNKVDLISSGTVESFDTLFRNAENTERNKLHYEINTLRGFQQMAVACDFDNCLSMYSNEKGENELTEEQIIALKVIHKSTPDFVLGYVSNRLLIKVEDSHDKQLVAIASLLIDIVKGENQKEKEGTLKSARKLIVRMAGA